MSLTALVLPLGLTDGFLIDALRGSKILALGLSAVGGVGGIGPSPARQPFTEGCVYLWAGCVRRVSGVIGKTSEVCVNSRRRPNITFPSDEAKDLTYLNRFLFTE